MIATTSPGKVVLWGEYAVLDGAPAAVVAVNRYARCTVAEQPPGTGWRFHAHGFDAPAVAYDRLPRTAPAEPAATLPWHVLQAFPKANLAPAAVNMHTEAFHAAGFKLGLGGSAALCVALQAAFAALGGGKPDYAEALAAHRRAQGGRGSGIDVAASFFGGCRRFQDGDSRPCPDALINRCFVWVGEAAQTTAGIDRLAHYVRRGDTAALRALADCSEQLFCNPAAERLQAYTSALKALDKKAGLGVYSAAHLALERLAKAAGLVYKPCGAGGGDVGMAVANTPEQLPGFAVAAREEGFTILNLETARHGVQLNIR